MHLSAFSHARPAALCLLLVLLAPAAGAAQASSTESSTEKHPALTGFAVAASDGAAGAVLPVVEITPEGPAPSSLPEEGAVARVEARLPVLASSQPREDWMRELTRVARDLEGRAVVWVLELAPTDGPRAVGTAFLFKRAAVAIRAGDPGAAVFVGGADEILRELYDAEIAPYADGVVLTGGEELPGRLDLVRERDITARAWVEPRGSGAAGVLEALLAGVDGVVLEEADAATGRIVELLPDSFSLRPARLAAGESDAGLSLRGDGGAAELVRILDLRRFGTLVLYRKTKQGERMRLEVDAAGLGRPAIVDLGSGRALDPGLVIEEPRKGTTTFALPGEEGQPVAVSFAALDLVERGERAEEVRVRERALPPVERIIAANQARRANQEERLRSYVAQVQTDMEFSVAGAGRSAELGIRSRLFHRRDQPPEYENLQYFLNGAPVRTTRLPNLPLVQPEKVQTLPLDLTLGKSYRYELQGEETLEGRSVYRVGFEPAEGTAPAYRGQVWIDARDWGRVKLRAVQTGLEPPILSFEQTEHYADVEEGGERFRLPVRATSEQSFSTLGANVTARIKVRYESYDLNPSDVTERLQAARDSDRQMLRDTDRGLRYLVEDPETGERVVQEEATRKARFWLAGLRYDRSLDFPLPLAGFNFLNFDWRGKGIQTNWFLAGLFNRFTISDPSLGGSKWGASANADLALISTKDRAFDARGNEVDERNLKVLEEGVQLSLWRSFGGFYRLEGTLALDYLGYDDDDDTFEEYRVPADNVTAAFTGTFQYRRGGWELDLWGEAARRSSWDPWGLPGENEDVGAEEAYRRWGLSVAKDWRLKAFQSLEVGLELMDGEDLDRFSRFQAGPFANPIGGFAGSGLRWDTGAILRLGYGWSILELAGLDVRLDWARLRDESVADEYFDNQGLSVSGSFTGPRGTVLNLDLGWAVGSELYEEAEGNVTFQILMLKLF